MKIFFGVLLNLICIVAIQAHAGEGGFDHGNGGDLCEDRFNIIRDDIASWIHHGGSAGLELPANISLNTYNSKMLDSIAKAQINCVDDTILIDGVEKTCMNTEAFDGASEITCNSQKFLAMSSTDQAGQYVLVHHEYAGLSGFEVNKGAESTYTISNQISEFLQYEVTEKLGVKKIDPSEPIDIAGYSKVWDCGTASRPWPDFTVLIEKDSPLSGGAVIQMNEDGAISSSLASYEGTCPLNSNSDGILRVYRNNPYSDQVIYIFHMDADGNITAKLLGAPESFICKAGT